MGGTPPTKSSEQLPQGNRRKRCSEADENAASVLLAKGASREG
jgi:hypothetical protein